jgi:hypothetical protein
MKMGSTNGQVFVRWGMQWDCAHIVHAHAPYRASRGLEGFIVVFPDVEERMGWCCDWPSAQAKNSNGESTHPLHPLRASDVIIVMAAA